MALVGLVSRMPTWKGRYLKGDNDPVAVARLACSFSPGPCRLESPDGWSRYLFEIFCLASVDNIQCSMSIFDLEDRGFNCEGERIRFLGILANLSESLGRSLQASCFASLRATDCGRSPDQD